MATQPLFNFGSPTETPPDGQTPPQDEAGTEEENAAALAEMRRRLAQIRKSNEGKYRAILSQGATPSPVGILAARLEALLTMLLTPEARLAFDLEFEGRMTEVLNECLANLRHQQIQVPAGAARQSGLIVPS